MGSASRDRTVSPSAGGKAPPPTPAGQELLTYLREICALLWPPPARLTLDGRGLAWPQSADAGMGDASAGHRDFILVPGLRHPRLLVPAAPRAAAAALRHYGRPASRAARLGAKALSIGLASGLGGTVVGSRASVIGAAQADTIETYLSRVMSQDLMVSLHLGVPRANRKPVLQLVTPAGQTIGFAKVGVNPLTCELVCAEHSSLDRLAAAGLAEVTVPRVLHHGEWHGLEVLVLSTLPTWRRRRPAAASQLASAMSEVARVGGLHREPFAGGGYARHLADRLAAADGGGERTALLTALEALTAWAGTASLTYGSWHGDWTQWNMASTDRGILVWDWERFTSGVPLGFDALHYWLQAAVDRHSRDAMAAASECIDRAAALLAPFGVPPAEARLTAVLYLIDLSTRYLADRQAKAGAPRGAPGAWLIPAIAHETARM